MLHAAARSSFRPLKRTSLRSGVRRSLWTMSRRGPNALAAELLAFLDASE
jgi:hypothetical protein